jgi:TonB-dependent receptor
VVTGVNAQAKAIAKQRANVNVSNVISSDQVSKFPDSNIGDALKRIPGINVQYDQGEARFGHIRGTSPDLSAVTVNGERLPSAEAEMRSVQLDLIPSDMIQSIEVNKVVMPEMDADAIGGYQKPTGTAAHYSNCRFGLEPYFRKTNLELWRKLRRPIV